MRAGPDGRREFARHFVAFCHSPEIKMSQRLADAHAADEVPHWRLEGRELTCLFRGRQEVGELDAAVKQSVLLAELLDVH
jgi:hypothetical protein